MVRHRRVYAVLAFSLWVVRGVCRHPLIRRNRASAGHATPCRAGMSRHHRPACSAADRALRNSPVIGALRRSPGIEGRIERIEIGMPHRVGLPRADNRLQRHATCQISERLGRRLVEPWPMTAEEGRGRRPDKYASGCSMDARNHRAAVRVTRRALPQ